MEFTATRLRLEYLILYNRIDIGLDPSPYGGHTTSLDAFWMGVPTITLVGKTAVGRGGLSQLRNLGLAELAAETPEQYVTVAADCQRFTPAYGASVDLTRANAAIAAHERQPVRSQRRASLPRDVASVVPPKTGRA